MSTVEIRDPGDMSWGRPAAIFIDGHEVPGVVEWHIKDGATFPRLVLVCQLGPVQPPTMEAQVTYKFRLPDNIEALRALRAQVETKLLA